MTTPEVSGDAGRGPGIGDERERRRLYAAVFDSPDGVRVLDDLGRACFAAAPTYVRGDAVESARREGMRAVWLRIGGILDPRPRGSDAPSDAGR
ncbi:MAG: hypothetical protein IPK81_15810 [Rhodospirillales bacterium]|nr:MAG: hypothetical protein IPK81_15810 [Rhodospirillales bacterium]